MQQTPQFHLLVNSRIFCHLIPSFVLKPPDRTVKSKRFYSLWSDYSHDKCRAAGGCPIRCLNFKCSSGRGHFDGDLGRTVPEKPRLHRCKR